MQHLPGIGGAVLGLVLLHEGHLASVGNDDTHALERIQLVLHGALLLVRQVSHDLHLGAAAAARALRQRRSRCPLGAED